MKKLFTFLFISSFFFVSFPQSGKIIINQTRPGSLINFPEASNQGVVADAMGYYCYLDQNGDKQIKSSQENILSTVFPGYPIGISGASFEGGVLCNMDSDDDLEIVYNIGYTIQAWNYDGTIVPGWPKSVSYPLVGAPAYGDIDGDGQAEIVVAYSIGSSGFVDAFEQNGSALSGFPVNNGYIIRSPVLADVDGDGFDEIVVTKTTYPTGQLYIYKGDGTVLNGWPQTMEDIPSSSSAVGDITNDGSPEIVAEAYGSIYAWSANGTMLAGFPYMLTGNDKTSYSSPVLADVDNDNLREIIFGTHDLGSGVGRLHIIKSDGTELPNFPKVTNYWIYGPPAVGYIDGDNLLDISVGDQVLSGSAVDKLYAWNVNGQALSGFPVGPLWAINDQVTIADIDNDTQQELIIDDNAFGEYHAYHNDGSPVSGWPLTTDGITFFNTPALADVNGDNVLDMLGAGITDIGTNPVTHVYLWNLEVPYNPARITVPVFQYSTRHNGVFVDPSTIPVELVSFTAESNGNEVSLKWETATELNNQGFEVQRRSGTEFKDIGFSAGHGTTT
ncbi:MAG TPA: FG-GAP-like repeat-containing protein, partial [Ignavibacteriaceae bacterium]|nr:FG-GAP-like repeat-containing protein [Ignavibacteriaceae bacterium]